MRLHLTSHTCVLVEQRPSTGFFHLTALRQNISCPQEGSRAGLGSVFIQCATASGIFIINFFRNLELAFVSLELMWCNPCLTEGHLQPKVMHSSGGHITRDTVLKRARADRRDVQRWQLVVCVAKFQGRESSVRPSASYNDS